MCKELGKPRDGTRVRRRSRPVSERVSVPTCQRINDMRKREMVVTFYAVEILSRQRGLVVEVGVEQVVRWRRAQG